MRQIIGEHRRFWNVETRRSLYGGFLLFLLGLWIQVGTGRYAARNVTNAVGDILLDNLPVVNLDFVIVEGALLFVILSGLLFIMKPRYFLFGLKAIALLLIVRALFISLTHLGTPPYYIPIDTGDFAYKFYKLFDFRGDLFFSGHTGFPFLMALLFWQEKFWRYIFLILTAVFGTSVLLAHIHYSIDVFAAPFIVYGVFRITEEFFKGDYKLLNGKA